MYGNLGDKLNTPPKTVPLKQGRLDAANKCEKKGHHQWVPARVIWDSLDGVQKVMTANWASNTHRACLRCGLVMEK